MIDTYYGTWEDQPRARYPRHVLERHTALCRYLELPETSHPRSLPKPLPPGAEEFAQAAVACSDEMFAWCPDGFDPTVDAFAALYDPPGAFDHLVYWGGRGGAKSTEIAAALVHHARTRKEIIVCARQFQNSIEASSKALIEEQVDKAGARHEFNITDHDITHLATGSEFSFIGLERNIASIKSRTSVTIVWIEEAEVVKQDAITILLPTVREQGSRFYWSFNPDREESPVDDLFRGDAPPERSKVFCVNVENNPLLYRTRMPSEMRSHWNKKKSTFQHVWRGDYNTNSEARVVPTDQVEIGYALIPDHLRPVYGMDFGTRDPQVLLKAFVVTPADMGLEPEAHRTAIYICGEAYEVGAQIKHMPTFIERVPGAGRFGGTIVADNSRPDLIEQIGDDGFDIQPCKKGPGSIKAGLDFISACDLMISPDCPFTIKEITKARWKTDPIGRVLDVMDPATGDHCWDALRYAVQQYQFASELQGKRQKTTLTVYHNGKKVSTR